MTDEDLHGWFHADGFRVDTEEYGEVDLWVVDRDELDTDAYVRGGYGGTYLYISVEGDCGDDGYRAFSASLEQGKREDSPTLTVSEMVAANPSEYEDLTVNEVESISE